MRRRWILLATATVIVAGAGLGGAVWYGRRSAQGEAARLAQAADAAAAAQDWRRAFTLYARLAERHPTKEVLTAAAQVAWQDGRKPEARLYAQRAWAAGASDRTLLGMLLADVGQEDHAKVLAEGRALIATMPDAAARARLEADLLADFGAPAEAVAAWTALCASQPSAAHALAGARVCLRHGRTTEARAILSAARTAGQLDAEGFHLLIAVVQIGNSQIERPDQAEPILPLFATARERGLLDDRLRLDEAVQLWTELRADEALAAAGALWRADGDVVAQRARRGARLLGAVILGEFGRRTEIAALATGLPVGAEGEGEALVYRTLATDPPERQLERLARAERLLGEQPLLTLVRARALAASGDRSAAQATYQGLPGLIATHPGVVLERAALLAGLDRRSEAVGAIMDLHRTRGPTRRSLLTLAELTAGEPSGPLVDAVQEALRAGGRTDAMLAAAATGYALRRGDSTLAATLSSELRRNHPTAAGSADLAGIRAALLAGDGAGALAACDRSTLAPGTVAAWRGMALTLLDRRGEALAAFAAADPAAMPALARIAEGDLAAEAGDAARARRTLTLAAGELPGPAQRRLALLALRAGEAEAALVAAESALAAEPEALGGQTLRALALAALDRRDEALAAAARVLNAQPGDPAMSRLRADLLLQQGDGTGAAQALSGAVAANPGRRDLVQRLAEVHLLLGQGPEAARLVEQLGDAADPVLTVRVRLAVGDVAGARARLAVLPATVSTGTRTVLAAGCARTSGDEAGALTLLAGHLEDPEVAVAWASLALIRPERPAVAVAVARHRLPPRTLVDLGVIAEQVGRWDEAAALLAQGLAQTPLDPVLNNNWAWAQLNLPHHDPVAVLAAAERARAALPTAPGVLDTVCLVHERAGRHRQVVGVLSEVADVTNRDARLLLHLANAREALGEREPALAALRQALERAKGITPWPLSTSEAALRERLARLERR